MGNASQTCVNAIYDNVKTLEEMGFQIKKKYDITDMIILADKKEKVNIIKLYKSFYYPTHSLRRLEEMHNGHYHLRQILKKNIKLYNKYNLTNIDVEDYVKKTVENLQPTLRVIGV